MPNLEKNSLYMGQIVKHSSLIFYKNDGCTIFEKGISIKIIKNVKMEKNRRFFLIFKYAANMQA